MTVSADANDQTATVTFNPPISVTYDPASANAPQDFACFSERNPPPTLTYSGTRPHQQYTGGTFNLGPTTVNCKAHNVTVVGSVHNDLFADAEFTVTVQDQPLSFANVPSTITFDATSPNGAIVTYTPPTASESGEPETFPVTCAPASGSVFAINAPGNFISVTCAANDPDGSTSAASFMVHVRGAAEQIPDLIAVVDSIPGAKKSFDNQLQNALADVNAGNSNSACGDLKGFINHVSAQSGKKQLTVSQANQLIAAAMQVRAVLGCGR